MKQIIMFSEARLAFEREIRENHPKIAMKVLLANSQSGTVNDEGINMGVVAAEFTIVMNGSYSPDQMETMYTHLYHRLVEKRKETIIQVKSQVPLPPGTQSIH